MTICVESSARLHLGFYNFFEDNIAYGGLGLAIETPRIMVRISKNNEFRVVCGNSCIEIDDVVNLIRKKMKIDNVSIVVEETYPRHIGLGSTTQLALSIGYGLVKLFELNYSIRELAALLNRGRDSGIGIAVFEHGGFVIDSGRRISDKVNIPVSVDDLPYVVFRSFLPDEWRFIVIIPRGIKGLDESREREAMDYPKPLPKELQYELYKLVLLHIIPSVVKKDIETFGKAVTKLQFIVGRYFSKFQGGIYCCKEVEEIVKTLLEYGAYGAGQSSWGPATYGIVDKDRSYKVLQKVLDKLRRIGIEFDYYLVKPRNRGVDIKSC